MCRRRARARRAGADSAPARESARADRDFDRELDPIDDFYDRRWASSTPGGRAIRAAHLARTLRPGTPCATPGAKRRPAIGSPRRPYGPGTDTGRPGPVGAGAHSAPNATPVL